MEKLDPRILKVLERWRESPLAFVEECIGAVPSNQQRQALEAVGGMARAKMKAFAGGKMTAEEKTLSRKIGISIRSGHGTGKDAWLSWIELWMLTCFSYPKGLVTAPTNHQLKDVLWSEINKWIRYSARNSTDGKSLLTEHLEWQSEKVFMRGAKEEWFVAARTANVKGSVEEQGETLAGMHADYMILAVDEASGVPYGVFAPLEGALTGKLNFAILIGNPTRGSGYFFDTHNSDRERWHCLHWNSEESDLVSREYISERAAKYGTDSNMYRIRVKGDFPLAEPDALIPLEWIQNAVDRELRQDSDILPVLGIDPARYGDDKTAILIRTGNIIEPIITLSKHDTMEIAGRVGVEISEREPAQVFIDVIGLGAGVVDRLRELGHRVTAVNVAEKAPSDEKFKRLRDELWWRVREKFEQGTISIPGDDGLMGELSTIKFKYESDGKIKVESKADMKKRGLKSPDKADALCLTYFFRDAVYADRKPDPYAPERKTQLMGELAWMAA